MRGGAAGTALVGDGPTVAARLKEYPALGIDTFVLSGLSTSGRSLPRGRIVIPSLA